MGMNSPSLHLEHQADVIGAVPSSLMARVLEGWLRVAWGHGLPLQFCVATAGPLAHLSNRCEKLRLTGLELFVPEKRPSCGILGTEVHSGLFYVERQKYK